MQLELIEMAQKRVQLELNLATTGRRDFSIIIIIIIMVLQLDAASR